MKKLILLPGGLLAMALLAFYLMPPLQDDAGRGGIEQLAQAESGSKTSLSVYPEVIPATDLPPEGSRSLFDHLIRENGSLPFPFSKFMDLLQSYDKDGQRPLSLLIPDGRSLLKGHADFSAPRIVVAANAVPPETSALAPQLKGRLFLGFVEDANEIEVISYNEAAGRFEFQLVENYCEACVPRIVYAKRAICTTCHVGEGPIFPVRPWEETNVQTQIQERLTARLSADSYHGAPLHRRLNDAQAFDDLTDIANVIPSTQKIWLDGCGLSGDDCRRAMLKLALTYMVNPAALDRDTAQSQHLLQLQQRHWPAQGIALNNGNLNNRNPLEQNLYDESFGAQLRNLFWAPAEIERTGDKLKDFDSLPALPAEFDPLTPRAPLKQILAKDLDGVFGVAQLFSPQDISRLEKAAAYSTERLTQAVDALPKELFVAAPVQRVQVVSALLKSLGEPAPTYCCLDVSEMSAPTAQGEPPLQLADDSVLKPFETYCFACHRGNPAARLDFMAGESEDIVLEKIQAQDSIRDVLDYERYLGSSKAGKLMPPTDSWQRQAILQALEAGEDPLSQMRDQVPSLFDF